MREPKNSLAIRLTLWLLLLSTLPLAVMAIFVRHTVMKTLAQVIFDEAVASSVMNSIQQTALVQLGISLFIISIAGGATIWLIIGRPLQQLTRAAKRMAAGDLDVTVNPQGMEDELGILALTFNQLAAQVRELVQGLQDRVADLQQTECALREAEEKYRGIFENAIEGIFQSTPEGQFISVNPAMAQIFGYASPEEMLSLITDIGEALYVDPARRVEFEQALKQNGIIRNFEIHQRRKDGTLIWVSTNARVIKDENGAVHHYEGTTQEITAQKQMEIALQQSRAERDRLFNFSLDLLCVAGFDGYFKQVNPAWTATLGWSVEELCSRPWLDFVHPDDRETTIRTGEALLAGQAVHAFENRYRCRDGGYRWLAWNSFPLVAERTIFAVVRDVTEHKQMEAARQRYLHVVTNMQLGLHVYHLEDPSDDHSLRLVDANPAGVLSLGLTEADLLGKTIDEAFPDLRARNIPQRYADVVRTGQPFTMEEFFYSQANLPLAAYAFKVFPLPNECVGILFEDITRRKQMEQERQESERRYRAISELVSDYIFRVVVEPDGKIVLAWVSDNFTAITGRSLAEAQTVELWTKIFHPDDLATAMAFLQQIVVSGKGGEIECRTFIKDRVRWVSIVAHPEWDEAARRTTAIMGAVKDITERKLAEAALRESEERFRITFHTSPDAININRASDGLFVDANAGFTALTGYSREEVIGHTSYEIDLWHDPQDRARMVAELQQHGQVENLEARFRLKDGRVKTGLMSARLLLLNGVPHILSITRDIEALKQVQVEREQLLVQIQEQAQRVQQIINSVPEGVILLDAGEPTQRRVLSANPMGEKNLAFLAGIAVGEVLTQVGDRPLEELLTSPPKGLWHQLEYKGQSFQLLARALETGPAARGWVLVIRDVTQQREFERHVQLQERLAAVGQLAAGIAHDFNNIMATIILYAQMTARSPTLSPRERERLTIINQQAHYATNLIQQILDFSRRSVLERQPVDLLPLLKEQVKLLERTLPENIRIRLLHGPDDYTINGDLTRLQQMFMNLAVNARDAMPEGGELLIQIERLLVADHSPVPLPNMAPGAWVKITVADTGTGIPPEALPHIFEPFFTTKAPGKGTGLGLAQVHGIVGGHEGHIQVQSRLRTAQTPGETVFTIYLPALPVTSPQTWSQDLSEFIAGQGETILIVEDNAATRAALVASLEALNYRPLTAANGYEALTVLSDFSAPETAFQIQLVISDVVMPEMGGLALVHAMYQQGFHTGVILLTGHPLKEELERLHKQGDAAIDALVRDWVLKPPTLEQLAQAITGALKAGRPAPAP